MATIMKNIFRNASTRILVIIFACLLGITTFFIVYGYYTQLQIFEEKELAKLESIAKSVALQIDGDEYHAMYSEHTEMDAITSNEQDQRYHNIHKILKRAQETNGIKTTMYTLVLDAKEKKFYYGVATSDQPFFRHQYKKYPPTLLKHYQNGAVIPQYETENGMWLSAFAPIKTSDGTVVGVLQLDEDFDAFIDMVNERAQQAIIISLIILLVVALILFRSIRSILRKEEQMTRNLIESKREIEAKNKDITDSIIYAKRIQDAILPSLEKIREALPNSFIYYRPRDIVSGDFYWFTEKDDRFYIAAVDCTGHGVPGAFMSMIGNTLLNDIVNHQDITETGKILDKLDAEIGKSLKQSGKEGQTRDGMDLAICAIDKQFKTIEFSGAFRPLLHIKDGISNEIKGNRFPIGGGAYDNKTNFTTHQIDINEGDSFFLFSDGFPDQFGGQKGKKFMNKQFKQLLANHCTTCQNDIIHILDKELQDWRKDYEQVDDIIVIGIRF
jgi:serine phosphatase RsbU (regulator of sigma subunit)